uniref:Uncharacterized protein n=1 Tax=Branchiostoma floridae TaxID=7739 RepID=C3YY06_BRAFL|eukprot:XP_002598953.1 hypothetical protein BRAFLDRAFT_79885 [Branchiostoma floridae]
MYQGNKVPHTEIRHKAGFDPLEITLLQSQLRWVDHVIRLPPNWLSRQVLYGELHHGRRSVEGQRKRFKDNLKSNMKKCDIIYNLEHGGEDRSGWKLTCLAGTRLYTERFNNQTRKTTKIPAGMDPKSRQTWLNSVIDDLKVTTRKQQPKDARDRSDGPGPPRMAPDGPEKMTP